MRKRISWKVRVALKLLFIHTFRFFPSMINDATHVRFMYLITFGRFPNLKKPIRFNEFICKAKLEDQKYDYWRYTDKYEVRKYVADTVGKHYLNECYGIYESFDEIPLQALPRDFVLKCTHGSGYNLLVPDKKNLDPVKAKKQLLKWLHENYYHYSRERNYRDIFPRIICEKFHRPRKSDITEYKIFCFHGHPKIIQYNLGLGKERRSNLYDVTWKKYDVVHGYENFNDDGKPPDNLSELLSLTKRLSNPFPFVRVDLYSIDGRIYFSELTFHSGGGCIFFDPPHFEFTFGKYFI